MNDHRTSITLMKSDIERIRKHKLAYMNYNGLTQMSDLAFVLAATSSIHRAVNLKTKAS